jgi:hypothetical protein
MSTGLIILIVVVALILLALLFLMPRMREKARVQKRERELNQRREAVAGQHREVADHRQREAEQAEREARMAQKEAERQRAEAELHQEKATMHERGDADHELIDDHERDRFAGTSAMHDRDGDGVDDRTEQGSTATGDTSHMRDGTTGAADSGERTEFEHGREVGHEEERRDERFAREDQPTDAPGSRRA